MPVLPFHKYIGPGNPTCNGPPVDEDDKIARQHDIRYDRAKNEEDVRRADIEAIIRFREDWLNGNWHSLIGDIGLSIKYIVETYTGVIYPNVDEVHINENEECRIIVVNNFLKLHCVFKKKPYLDKYKIHHFRNPEDTYHLPEILRIFEVSEKNFHSIIPPYLYVPVNWNEVYSHSQIDSIFNKEFIDTMNSALEKAQITKTDGLKIARKYLQWKYIEEIFFINRNADKSENKDNTPDILSLIHSGYVYVDQDWNIHLEKTY